MTSKREQILAKIKTNLTGTTGVGSRIFRSRSEPLTRAESPSLVIEFVTDQPTINSATYLKLDWTLRVRIVVVVRSQTPDTSADPTIESLHTKIVSDPTLGGLAIDVRPSTVTFDVIEADQPAGVVFCEYEIDYRSDYNDLST
ncbi:MAG TPA: hypothetical protein DEO59_01680 [Balneola sp.]|nr:hypothetical protein [Balneola sp.]|tara:strand:+ start:1017 stop:1445 length:429 start_codon:yes stop_codon:yes gene_type:complete